MKLWNRNFNVIYIPENTKQLLIVTFPFISLVANQTWKFQTNDYEGLLYWHVILLIPDIDFCNPTPCNENEICQQDNSTLECQSGNFTI